jgi:hypothetical protein
MYPIGLPAEQTVGLIGYSLDPCLFLRRHVGGVRELVEPRIVRRHLLSVATGLRDVTYFAFLTAVYLLLFTFIERVDRIENKS